MSYGAHSVRLQTGATSLVLLPTTASSIPANASVLQDDSGSIYDKYTSIASVSPTPQFTTKEIAAALQVLGVGGLCLSASGALRKVEQFFEAKSPCNQTALPNISFDTVAGLLKPVSLSASRGESATLSMELDSLSGNGTTAPVVLTESVTLPTNGDANTTPTEVGEFVLNSVQVAGITLADTQSAELAYGVEVADKEPALGSVFPTTATRVKVRPTLTLGGTTLNRLKDAGVPLLGKSALHADTKLWFRKRKNRAALEDLATTVHFSITLSGLLLFDTIASGSGSARASNSLRLTCIQEGSTAPLVYTFGVAIT
jgi:hypothetical protein